MPITKSSGHRPLRAQDAGLAPHPAPDDPTDKLTAHLMRRGFAAPLARALAELARPLESWR